MLKSPVFYLQTVAIAFLAICLVSCVNTKKLTYFNNITRDSVSNLEVSVDETVIRNNDILQITITTLDEQSTRILNGVNALPGTSMNYANSGVLNGYLVDENGKIKLPLVGSVTAAGLNKKQFSDYITKQITDRKFALDPVVAIRIVNYKVTVLGEVNKPGVIPVPNEHITIPEALGQAGDLTPYGKRESLLLIREINGKRIFRRFSLNSSDFFDKDFYYLQNQDIIYVEPNKARAGSTDRSTQLLPILISSLSFLAIIFSQVIRNN